MTFNSGNADALGCGESDIKAMANAHGFVFGQNYSVERLSKKFPQLAPQLQHAQFAFEILFPNVNKNLREKLKSCGFNQKRFDDAVKPYLEKTKQFADQQFSRLSFEQAQMLANEYTERFRGHFAPDIQKSISALTDLCYKDDTLRVIRSGLTQLWTSNAHPKAQGLKFSAEVPLNWVGEEARRPHIVRKWHQSLPGVENTLLFLVKKSPEFLDVAEADIREALQSGILWAMISPELWSDMQKISTAPIRLDSAVGFKLEFSGEMKRGEGLLLRSHTIFYVLFFKDYFLSVQLSSTSTKENMDKLERAVPALKAFAPVLLNSVTIESAWK